MPDTAPEYGIDPRDPAQAISGEARYLRDLHRTFGNWTLAVAAYKAGPGAVQKYGGVPPYPETQDYVRRVLGGVN